MNEENLHNSNNAYIYCVNKETLSLSISSHRENIDLLLNRSVLTKYGHDDIIHLFSESDCR